jgi:protein-S-isoprenylcysteine O-methyltransferase Ste14
VSDGSRLPSLGPRGEGWLIGQIVFIVAIASAPGDVWAEPARTVGQWSGALLAFGGAVLAARAVFDLGPNLTPFPRPRQTGVLVDHGIYRVLRNPVYAGLVLITVGWSLIHGSAIGLVLSIVFAGFLDLKARREEELLAAAFPDYEAYRRRTKRFVPGLY